MELVDSRNLWVSMYIDMVRRVRVPGVFKSGPSSTKSGYRQIFISAIVGTIWGVWTLISSMMRVVSVHQPSKIDDWQLHSTFWSKDLELKVEGCLLRSEKSHLVCQRECQSCRQVRKESGANDPEIIFADKSQSWIDGALFRTEIASFDIQYEIVYVIHCSILKNFSRRMLLHLDCNFVKFVMLILQLQVYDGCLDTCFYIEIHCLFQSKFRL